MADSWEPGTDGDETDEEQVARIVSGLIALANDAEAGRILGIGGTLEDELDVLFLSDPLGWIATDIARAMQLEEEEEEGVSLSSVVAQLRLYRVLRGEPNEQELRGAVLEALREAEEEEEE